MAHRSLDIQGMSLVILGFGAVGSALWTCARLGWGLDPSRCVVFERSELACALAVSQGLETVRVDLSKDNLEEQLGSWLGPGVVVANLGVGIQSGDVMGLCRRLGALYIDAGIDDWEGEPTGSCVGEQRARLLARFPKQGGVATAIIGQGANPGLASHWAKLGLEHLASEYGLVELWESSGHSWPWLARTLGLRVVQVAERDHGIFEGPAGAFCNTWSVDGLAKEALLPGELGWGSHEERVPMGARLVDSAGTACVALGSPGYSSWVRTWTPLGGPAFGLAIPHLESVGLTAHFSDGVGYAPSCFYAYQPCPQALAGLERLAVGDWSVGGLAWIPGGEDLDGMDELGALLMGEHFGSLWVGSRLDSKTARTKAEGSSATTLQVAAGLWAGIEWALLHPAMGLVEPENLPHVWILDRASTWIGPTHIERSHAIEPLDLPAPVRAEDLRFVRFLVGTGRRA